MVSNERITVLVEPVVEALGYFLYAVVIEPALSRVILRIYIDKPGGVTVDACQEVSRQISGVLDVANVMTGAYVLEVSSPGLDRPLLKLQHYVVNIGKKARVRVRENGAKRSYIGILQGLDGNDVMLMVDGETIRIPLATVEKARLIPEFP